MSECRAYRLLMIEDDAGMPGGKLKIHYIVRAKSGAHAAELVKAARQKPCAVTLLDDSESTQGIAARMKIADGQAVAT